MSRYSITADEIRRIIGVKSSDISDSDMNSIINDAEYEVEKILHTTFVPKRALDVITSTDGSNVAMLRKTPVNRIVSIRIGGTAGTNVQPNDVLLYPESGRLVLSSSASKTEFDDTRDNNNAVEYYYSRMDETTTETTLDAYKSPSASTGTDLSVGTVKGFDTDSYIKIEGVDGKSEITQITGTSPSTGTISTQLSLEHGTGSRVVLMETPRMVTELIRTVAGIMSAIHMVGSTYTFATSYSIPELSATKGVPYPHFEKVLSRLTEKQNSLMKRIRPESFVYV